LHGFGFVVPRRENRSIKAGSWTSLKFPGRCRKGTTVIRASISGSKVDACIRAEDAQIDEWVRLDLQAIAGIHAMPLMYKVYRWPKSRPQYTLGHSERVATIFQHLSRHENLYVTGCAYAGAGVAKCIRQSRALSEKIIERVAPQDRAVERE
jgi:oxygen-dependent protoporphyrinogen oxidase